VPARDEKAVIAACVESLAKQSEITEIVVVDDQSSDKTAAIVKDLATRIASCDCCRNTNRRLAG
jgi:glycosyltransferase involved in cell wall biosynthesis